jgi:hypothetical protein
MTLTICYKKGLQFREVSHFLPFLKTIERYPFPKPLNCSRTSVKLTWLKTTIVSFTSKKFLSYLDSWKGSMHWIQVDSNDATRIHLAINQTGENVIVLSNLSAFIHPAQIKQLFVVKKMLDEFGIIHEGNKILPKDLKISFLEALAELEDNECHKNREFPKTRLHKITGVKQAVYRADIDKISGWRIHVQYDKISNVLILKDIIEGQKQDEVIKVIKSKKNRYE